MQQKRLAKGLIIAVAAFSCAAGYYTWNAPHAQAADGLAAGRVFVGTGTDDNGNFQAALEDALAQADAFFGQIGADIRYTYEVLSTTGERGGIVFYNNIYVTIRAEI